MRGKFWPGEAETGAGQFGHFRHAVVFLFSEIEGVAEYLAEMDQIPDIAAESIRLVVGGYRIDDVRRQFPRAREDTPGVAVVVPEDRSFCDE